ncbi:MAG: hypothetical protein D8H98_06500 [Prevotella sp.]|jgi:hypothetical protein|nr:MAG: hypothetical protein D8H98_06500 [Prevotella sp.]DAR00720.1 MAG TPA: hypothetical protein [Caudoviricetes sp.]
MNMQSTKSVAIALGSRELELTADALGHLEEIKRASHFYLKGLDGIIRTLIMLGRAPAEALTPERSLELLDIASEIKGHIQAIAAINMYANGVHVEPDLPTYDQ